MTEDSETFRALVEIRGLLNDAKRDAGIEMVTELGKEGLVVVERLVRESEERSRTQWTAPPSPDGALYEKLLNLQTLTSLAEKLYPGKSLLEGVEKVRVLLKEMT